MEKKKLTGILLSIILLVVMVIGLSYAWYSLILSGTKNLTISTSGSLSLVLDDSMDGEITLTEAEPVSDETGKAQKGYTFTLKNNGTIASDYTIYLDDMPLTDESNRIPDNKIKYYLEKDTTELATKLLSETGVNPNRILDTGNIAKGTTITYKLKLWIDSAAGNEVMGKELKTKVRVVANQSQTQPTGTLLKDAVLAIGVNENPATLTTTSKEVNENGLFKSTDTNDGSPTYFFRGAVENNYLKFANLDWRIIRINEDGTIRIRLANGINNDQGYRFNSVNNTYDKMYYTNSTLKPIVDNWYQGAIGNNPEYASKVVQGNYFCEQAKVKYNASYTSGNATMVEYTSYTPNFKCATDGYGKGYVNSQVGLITIDELIHAGGYWYKSNDTIYLYREWKFNWSMSPAAFYGAVNAWYLIDGDVSATMVNEEFGALPVLNLSADVLATGTGTSTDPFVVQ